MEVWTVRNVFIYLGVGVGVGITTHLIARLMGVVQASA
jgi:hypothetical protein